MGCVLQICMVFSVLLLLGKPDDMLRDFSLVVDLIILAYIIIKDTA